MNRTLSVALLALVPATVAFAGERNYTLRGDGWFDGDNIRFGRLAMREVRMTLRDNGEFAVTLFVRNERYLVRGRWDRRRGGSNAERIELDQAFGQRASGSGTLHYAGNGNTPQRLALEGRTPDGTFRADIAEERGFDWNDPRDRDDRSRYELGRNGRLYEDVQVDAAGDGVLRMAGVRDGRVQTLRATLRTNRDVRIDLARPSGGSIRGEVIAVTGNQVRVRVEEVMGVRSNGELEVMMRGRDELAVIRGSGGSTQGSWQFDFEADRRGSRRDRDDRDDWGWSGTLESNDRGSGRLRQDIGPDLTFDRMRTRLDANGSAWISLEGRGQSVELRGTWRGDGRSNGRNNGRNNRRNNGRDEVRIELASINEMGARGRLTLERTGNRVERLEGDGRTDRGRFDVRFSR